MALAEAVVRLFQMTAQERSILGTNGQSYFKTHFDHNMLTDQLISHIKMVAEDYRSKK
jgi:hypothetical protein